MNNEQQLYTLQSFISLGDLSYEEAITRPQYVAQVSGTILAISGHNELRQSITIIPFPSWPGASAKAIKTRSKFRCQCPYCAGEAWDGQLWPPQSARCQGCESH